MNTISGSRVKDTNSLYRLLIVTFAGIMAFAVLLSWRAQLLFTAGFEGAPIPIHRSAKASLTAENNANIQQELNEDKSQKK